MNAPSFDPGWNLLHRERQWGCDCDPRVFDFMAKHFGEALRAGRQVRVLDIGTGYGAQAFPLADMGYWVDAVDASEIAIFRAQQRKTEECTAHERLNLSCCDVTRMRYSNAMFDAAIDVATLEYLSWDDGRKAIGEVLRVLKPGGWFFSLTAADDYAVEGKFCPAPARKMTVDLLGEFHRGFVELHATPMKHVDGLRRLVSWWLVHGRKPRIGE